jgi:pimeloyl-ACP methyl ester carboxylesterase
VVPSSVVVGESVLAGVRDFHLTRADGRVVAWSEWGHPDGFPLLRVPGTPGCRFSALRGDRSPWTDRGLRVITTERPGFGASTRLPGRGFLEPADDIAAILDDLELEAVHMTGASGAAPHELAFAARHPERVRAMTVVAGAAPTTEEDEAEEISVRAEACHLVRTGDLTKLAQLLAELRSEVLRDPLASFRARMDKAPGPDRALMQDPNFQGSLVVGFKEALRLGADGWFDEAVALETKWGELDLTAMRTSLTWWHAGSDANAPLRAAQRLLAKIPHAQLRLFGDDEGHLAGYRREGEILDELLARG